MPAPAEILFLVLDVDGVLTDGSIIINDRGEETKHFHVRDGAAIKWAMMLGMKVGILTGRSSRVVTLRAQELGVEYVIQGARHKAIGLETLCQQAGVEPEQTAYMGDDIVDLPAMLRCAYKITVADGAEELKAVADYVTETVGGHGAVREAIEHLIKAQGRWEEVMEEYGV